MSIRHLIATMELEYLLTPDADPAGTGRKLPPSHKLALAAIADDASDKTNRSFPGLEKIMKWSGTGKRRALELLEDLSEHGFIERVEAGFPGKRAVYLVTLPAPSRPVDNSEIMGAESRTTPEMGAENPEKVRDLAPLSLDPLRLTPQSSSPTHVNRARAESDDDQGIPDGWRQQRKYRKLSTALDDDELVSTLGSVFHDFEPENLTRIIRSTALFIIGKAVSSGVRVAFPNRYVTTAVLAEPEVYRRRAFDMEAMWTS